MSIRNNILTRHSALHEFASSNSRVGSQRRPHVSHPSQRWIIWFVVIGMFLPYTIGETGKYVIAFFFLPAILVFITSLTQGKRQVMACDIFVWAASLWMVAVKIGEYNSDALFVAGSDALAFVGSYMLARAFIYDKSSIKEFMRALKFVAVVLIALSVFDTLSGTFFINELITKFIPHPRPYRSPNAQIHRSLFGIVVLRAASTFGHPILYGTFCSIAGAFIFDFQTRRSGTLLRSVFGRMRPIAVVGTITGFCNRNFTIYL